MSRPGGPCRRCQSPAFVVALPSASHPVEELLCLDCLLEAIEAGELADEAAEDGDDVDDEEDESRWGT